MELQIRTQNLKDEESAFFHRFLTEKVDHLKRFFGKESFREGMIVRARLEHLPHRKSYHLHLKTHLYNRDVEYTHEGHELSQLLREGWKRFERSVIKEWKVIRMRWSIARHHQVSLEELRLRNLLQNERLAPDEILPRIQEELSTLWQDLLEYARHELRFREYVGELPQGLLEPEEVLHQAVLRLLEELKRGGEPPEDLRAYLLRSIRILLEEETIRQGRSEPLPFLAEEEEGEEDLEILPETLKKEIEAHPEREKEFVRIFSELSPRDRALVRLSMEGDRTLPDLARIYGVSLDSVGEIVKSVLTRIEDVRRRGSLVSS